MKRISAALLGFLGLPLFMAAPVWLPLLFGATGSELERLETNAYPLVRLVPSLALSGTILCWALRRKFFDSLVVAGLVGLATGALSSLFTYLTYGRPIVNARPFFTIMPMLGVFSAMLSHVLAARFEGRLKGRRGT